MDIVTFDHHGSEGDIEQSGYDEGQSPAPRINYIFSWNIAGEKSKLFSYDIH